MEDLGIGDTLQLSVKCRCCGKTYKLRVRPDDLYAWQNGDLLVQEAFPYLKPEERELLLTRTCPTCWDNMFSQDEY